MSLPTGLLLGIENPLLDISAHVDQAFLDNLKAGNAKLAEPQDLPLYQDLVKNHSVEYIAGGSCQNSMRAFAYMVQQKKVCRYIGCVGKDENGKILRNAAENDGVSVHYLEDAETPTGTCAVCIVKKERSLVANLAAANKYKRAHLDGEEIQGYVKQAKYFYSTGYFLTVSPDSALELGKHAAATNKTFAFNLAAPFVMEFFSEPFDALLPYIDVLFGNETEAAALAKKRGWNSTDVKVIAEKAAALPKENKSRPRLVVFTQGADPAVAVFNGHTHLFPATRLSKDLIVDTNGAGDSFVGGFLSRYVQGRELAECVAAGHWCAAQVIQVSGCQFPWRMVFEYHSTHPHHHAGHPESHCHHAKSQAVIGKPAPDFTLPAVRNGEIMSVKLADYKGKWLILFFYPLDFTFVCPTEIIAFADRAGEFRKLNADLAAVSVDSVFTHLAWTKTARKAGGLGAVDIPLLSDINKTAAAAYGVLVPDGEDAGVTYRGLFIISPKGVLRQITINDLPVGRSVDETLRLLQAFQFTDEHGEVCPANWTPGAATMKADPKQSLAYFSKQH